MFSFRSIALAGKKIKNKHKIKGTIAPALYEVLSSLAEKNKHNVVSVTLTLGRLKL